MPVHRFVEHALRRFFLFWVVKLFVFIDEPVESDPVEEEFVIDSRWIQSVFRALGLVNGETKEF